MEITGDPLPYGIAPNRRVIDELIGHALTQGIITKPVTADELFAPSTRAGGVILRVIPGPSAARNAESIAVRFRCIDALPTRTMDRAIAAPRNDEP